MFNCVVCEKSLTGGLDTFGATGEELCEEHRWTIEEQTIEAEIDALRVRLEPLQDAVEEAEEALSEARANLYEQEHKIDALLRKLERIGKPVAMW